MIDRGKSKWLYGRIRDREMQIQNSSRKQENRKGDEGTNTVDGGGAAVAGQERGMVDDGLVLRVSDHLHGNELCHIRQHIHIWLDTL